MDKSTLDALNIADSKTSLENLADATENAAKKAKLKQRAETAEELKAKYGKKRFSSSNAWKIVLFNYVYAAYQIDEGAKTGEIEQLYSSKLQRGRTRSAQDIVAKIDSLEDMLRYNSFVHLQEWTEDAFKTTVFMRNALRSVISDYYNIASSLIAAEELVEALGDKAEDPKVSLWLSILTVEHYSPQKHGDVIYTLRRNITLALRYIKAYNTFIDMIASAVNMPEFTIFKVDTQGTDTNLSELNEKLSALVSTVHDHRGLEDEYLNETLLKAFSPIEREADPIPDANIKKSAAIISALCQYGNKSWTSAFAALYAGYWRQV